MFYGEGAVAGLKELQGPDKKAFIVMSGTILEETGALKLVTDTLKEAGFSWEVYTEVEPEPSFHTVKKGAAAMKAFKPDWVIGFGGGSAMDAAKAMWVFYENPELTALDQVAAPKEIPVLKERARICCIPTSAGTGSEATRAALIKDTEKRRKYSIRCLKGRLIPDVAILDPIFTVSMPKSLTAASGMDAITHAIEAYVTPVANPYSDAMAIAAFINGFRYLPRCYEEKGNLEARAKMLAASCMAGIAFSNCALGLTHSAAHAFGAEFGIPHGLANAVILPYNLKFNERDEKTLGRYQELASFIGEASLLQAIKGLNQRLDIPEKLQDVIKDDGAFEAKLDLLIQNAMEDVCTAFAPVKPTQEEMRAYLLQIYYGTL